MAATEGRLELSLDLWFESESGIVDGHAVRHWLAEDGRMEVTREFAGPDTWNAVWIPEPLLELTWDPPDAEFVDDDGRESGLVGLLTLSPDSDANEAVSALLSDLASVFNLRAQPG